MNTETQTPEASVGPMKTIDLGDMSLRELVALHNRFAEKPVKRFKNTATGIETVGQLLETVGQREGDSNVFHVDMSRAKDDDEDTKEPADTKANDEAKASRSADYVPADFHKDATVHYTNPRDCRPGSNSEKDQQIFAFHDGGYARDIAPKLKTRWGALRYWAKRGVITIRAPGDEGYVEPSLEEEEDEQEN